jgi:hypothetical protein
MSGENRTTIRVTWGRLPNATPERLGTGVYPVKVDDQCEPVRLEPKRVKHLS